MIKINVGCGKRNFGEDWFHVDGDTTHPHVSSDDVFLKSWTDKSVDLIYASHLIAYFDREEVVELFKAWKRVLKDGGVLRIATPDFEAIVNNYVLYKLDSFVGPLYGKMKMGNETVYHKTAYDSYSLTMLLDKCGFINISNWNWRNTEHAHIDDHSQAYLPHMDKENGVLISLNVECTA